MGDIRVEKMARILVDYSTAVKPGDRVMIEATTAAEPLVRAVYQRVLERGGHPHILLSLIDQEEVFFRAANDEQFRDRVKAARIKVRQMKIEAVQIELDAKRAIRQGTELAAKL